MKKLFFITTILFAFVYMSIATVQGSETPQLTVFEEDVRMCTMQYAPVCGVDGKTYGNSCMAGDIEISYQGECEEVTKTMIDTELYSKLENNEKVVEKIKVILSKTSNNLLEKVIKKIDQRIEMIKLSRIVQEVQVERITKLVFIRDLIEVALISK